MNWTERQILFVVEDLIAENPLACRALFRMSAIEFTDKVDTMAVSISASPVLYINLDFCNQHLENETDVKTVLLHEFLHVLLLHTEKYTCNSPLLNICLDAIINAIIYRNQGMEYAGFFARFYKWEKLSFLLRPICGEEPMEKEWMDIYWRVYRGQYCADDLMELLEYMRSKMNITGYEDLKLLGNHAEKQEAASGEVSEILDGVLRKMKGVRIWNKGKSASDAKNTQQERVSVEEYRQHSWDAATLRSLKKCLVPHKNTKVELKSVSITTPVLTYGDQRSLAKYLWTGLIPFSTWQTEAYQPVPDDKAHIYLDVSGSMQHEIDRLVNLLFHFRKFINRPLWVFSNDVKEAFFIGERLVYDTSFGTQIEPVFDHMRAHKIKKALIVTDGYVDSISRSMLHDIDKTKIHVLLSAGGNPAEFENASIGYTRLQNLN